MKKLMTVVLVAACTANAFAMPTKEELKKAQPLVAELMATPMAGFKAAAYKEKSAAAAKVADTSVEFAKAAETEAAKFLLLKGAVSYYVRAEQYGKAADAIKAMQSGVKDIPPAVIVEITGKAAGKISEAKAPELFAIYRQAKLQSRAGEDVKTLAAKLKKVQSDAIRRRYAEALAISGDWKSAYAEFAKINDPKLKAIAEAEASGKAKSAEAGEFWWDYKFATEDAEDFFKAHAAAFYRKALAAGEITGLKKNLVVQRIKDVPVTVGEASGLPVARQDAAPTASGNGAWQENGKTAWLTLTNGEKIKFIRCPKGKFRMLNQYAADGMAVATQMDHEFWISDTITTLAHLAAAFPEKGIKVDDKARKSGIEIVDTAIDAFVSNLQDASGSSLPSKCVIRLPSVAEFEYAYHADAKSPKDPYFHLSPPGDVKNDMRSIGKAPGQNLPNAWGIHDMLCHQRFLDRFDAESLGQLHKDTDENCYRNGFTPDSIKFDASSGKAPFFWSNDPDSYVMWMWHGNFKHRHVSKPDAHGKYAFHLVVGPDLVGEWKAKHGKK